MTLPTFTVQSNDLHTGRCISCGHAESEATQVALDAAMSRHGIFTHDVPYEED